MSDRSLRPLMANAHSKTGAFARRLNTARTRVAEAVARGWRGYVALSGGKDSTAVLGLVRELDPTIPAVWSDDEFFLPETAAYMLRLRKSGLDLHTIRTSAWHTGWFQTAGQWSGIPEYAANQDWQLAWLGLRADENAYRRKHLRKFGWLFFCQRDDFWHANPIWDWSALDVWAYIHTTGQDYNRAYDRMDRVGIPLDRQRIGPFACERALNYGQLAILRELWPEEFARFVAAHPEARRYC